MSRILEAIDFYGNATFIRESDFATCQHMIPIVTRDGRDIRELPSFRPGMCDMLAVANIETVRPAGRPAEREARRLARKAQDFDTSTLPLFGDGHRQTDLFG